MTRSIDPNYGRMSGPEGRLFESYIVCASAELTLIAVSYSAPGCAPAEGFIRSTEHYFSTRDAFLREGTLPDSAILRGHAGVLINDGAFDPDAFALRPESYQIKAIKTENADCFSATPFSELVDRDGIERVVALVSASASAVRQNTIVVDANGARYGQSVLIALPPDRLGELGIGEVELQELALQHKALAPGSRNIAEVRLDKFDMQRARAAGHSPEIEAQLILQDIIRSRITAIPRL